jgi:hypothetical protein
LLEPTLVDTVAGAAVVNKLLQATVTHQEVRYRAGTILIFSGALSKLQPLHGASRHCNQLLLLSSIDL